MLKICDATFGDIYYCPDCKVDTIVHTCLKHPIKPWCLKCSQCGKNMVPGIVSQ